MRDSQQAYTCHYPLCTRSSAIYFSASVITSSSRWGPEYSILSLRLGVKPAKTVQAVSLTVFDFTGEEILNVKFKVSEEPATSPQPTHDTGRIVG